MNHELDPSITKIFAETVIAYGNHCDKRVIVATGTMSSIIIGDKHLQFYICSIERRYWDVVKDYLTNNGFIHWNSSSVFVLTTNGQIQARLFAEQNNIDFSNDLRSTLKELTGGVLFAN